MKDVLSTNESNARHPAPCFGPMILGGVHNMAFYFLRVFVFSSLLIKFIRNVFPDLAAMSGLLGILTVPFSSNFKICDSCVKYSVCVNNPVVHVRTAVSSRSCMMKLFFGFLFMFNALVWSLNTPIFGDASLFIGSNHRTLSRFGQREEQSKKKNIEEVEVLNKKEKEKTVLLRAIPKAREECPPLPPHMSRNSFAFQDDGYVHTNNNSRVLAWNSSCVWRKNMSTTREYLKLSKKYEFMKQNWGTQLVPKHLEVACGRGASSTSFLGRMLKYFELFRQKDIQNIVFFGDSVMQQQFDIMTLIVQSLKTKNIYDIQVKYTASRGEDGVDTVKHIDQLFEVASSPRSVIVANLGLHYQHTFGTTGRPALLLAVSLLLQRWNCTPIADRPRLIWREGTPLQYPSPNGWWSPTFRGRCHQSSMHRSSSAPTVDAVDAVPTKCCACVSLSKEMRLGNISESLSNATMWDVYPAQAMDMAVLPLLQQHRVPVARVYSALAARADLHAGLMAPDCTHFGIDALMYLNEEVMKTIAVGG